VAIGTRRPITPAEHQRAARGEHRVVRYGQRPVKLAATDERTRCGDVAPRPKERLAGKPLFKKLILKEKVYTCFL